jgi:hypothetical protein
MSRIQQSPTRASQTGLDFAARLFTAAYKSGTDCMMDVPSNHLSCQKKVCRPSPGASTWMPQTWYEQHALASLAGLSMIAKDQREQATPTVFLERITQSVEISQSPPNSASLVTRDHATIISCGNPN